jgi:translation initiation factor 5B
MKTTTPNPLRQPIVTVCGHVDHGKTSLLDNIRGTSVQEGEAGGITQKISFTLFPKENLLKRCPLIEKNKIKMEIPGFLFIDTPGHAAFSNLRKRGGALADLAIVVIDINEGIKPQTAEVLSILKANKTPFIIALNKVDNISGWRKQSESMFENINAQASRTKEAFIEKLFTLEGSLNSYGFNALPFYEINDFTKNLALVPCSARTGEGLNELIMTLCGLSQKFLKERLKLGEDAKGVILEIKKDKNIVYLESILYDGKLESNDEIAIASFSDLVIGRIRILEEIKPLSNKFKTSTKVTAATGLRIQLTEQKDILPGMPFQIFKNNKSEIEKEFKKQVQENIDTSEQGIIIKAESLGSLEAMMVLLKQEGISVCKAGIGNIDKRDIINANTNFETDPLNAIILGFNVSKEEEVTGMNLKNIKIIESDVVYRLIEQIKEYRDNKRRELEREKMMSLATICKLKILPQYVFHNSNPAIFGVKIEAGKLKANMPLMNEQGEEVERVRNIQVEKDKVDEATAGMEVAISLGGTNFERQLADKEYLYSDMSGKQFKAFKDNKDLLSREEIEVLQKISQIKRAKDPSWGV